MSIPIQHGKEYWHKVNATQKAIMERMGTSRILEVHSDGDLTFEAEGRVYVLTTDGQTFVKVPLHETNGPGAMPQVDGLAEHDLLKYYDVPPEAF